MARPDARLCVKVYTGCTSGAPPAPIVELTIPLAHEYLRNGTFTCSTLVAAYLQARRPSGGAHDGSMLCTDGWAPSNSSCSKQAGHGADPLPPAAHRRIQRRDQHQRHHQPGEPSAAAAAWASLPLRRGPVLTGCLQNPNVGAEAEQKDLQLQELLESGVSPASGLCQPGLVARVEACPCTA